MTNEELITKARRIAEILDGWYGREDDAICVRLLASRLRAATSSEGAPVSHHELPYVINPEAIANPDDMPIVQLPPDAVAAMRRAGFICGCGGMNGRHQPDCTRPTRDSQA